jgi:predicted AlkP superfamily phosphohydrolase/phosphomutase
MKTIIIGFDAFDPAFFERLHDQGRLPHLGKYVTNKGYAHLAVSNPAQSEVSWTSIATGMNPGHHGLFDFVHRNPSNYALHVSLLPTKKSTFGVQFVPPYNAPTVFDHAVEMGYPATTLWWPATFPARRQSPVRTIPGLGTPDILGRLGVGTYFKLDPNPTEKTYKTNLEILTTLGTQKAQGILKGPLLKSKDADDTQAHLPFEIEWIDANTANLRLNNKTIPLEKGRWSPFIELNFKLRLGVSIRATTQALLTENSHGPGVYFLPLQIHPLKALWPYANPGSYAKELWKNIGPYHTLGWPQDTTALDEGFIQDDHFLHLCDAVLATREKVLMKEIQAFKEGILAIVFDSLDRIQHMFRRDREDIIESWYLKLDALLGRIETQIKACNHQDARILVLSDHGFSEFNTKVHLNRWLIDHDYLFPANDHERGGMQDIVWQKTRAYAVGLSSIYLNRSGRERDGIVMDNELESLSTKIKEALLSWEGPDKRKVVRSVWTGEEAFPGPLTPYAPDLVIGFNAGYRASGQTGLGSWEPLALEKNLDHWGADHCIDPGVVPGVLFANTSLEQLSSPSYADIPDLVIGGKFKPRKSAAARPPVTSDEDRETLEERLKDLGYL